MLSSVLVQQRDILRAQRTEGLAPHGGQRAGRYILFACLGAFVDQKINNNIPQGGLEEDTHGGFTQRLPGMRPRSAVRWTGRMQGKTKSKEREKESDR